MQNSKHLSNVTFISAVATYKGDIVHSQMRRIDLGSIYLKKEDREYNQDVTDSFWKYDRESDTSTIEMLLDVDEDDLKEIFFSNFELTETDIVGTLDKAEIFIAGEYEEEPTKVTMYIRVGEEEKEINLTLEEVV